MSTSVGIAGEEIARSFLAERGYKILKKNFRSRFGEIDIIALDQDTLVFVEVKARWSKKFGAPEEAVTPWKLNRIKKAAMFFLLKNPNSCTKQRIEVVAIEIQNGQALSTKLIKVD